MWCNYFNKQTDQNSQKSATKIDNAITTNIFDESLKKGIIESDLSYFFHIFYSIRAFELPQKKFQMKFQKCISNENNLDK